MLKWAAISHDLKKQGLPFIYGRDYIHPFKSANVLIEIFIKLKIIRAPVGSKERKQWDQV